jgi:Tfp pilus assembly protein PilF
MHIALAKAYLAKGLLARADQQLDLAEGAAPQQFSAYYEQLGTDLHLVRGQLRLRQGRLPEAAKELEAAVTAKPDSGLAHRYLSEVYARQGLREKAADEAALAAKYGSPVPPAGAAPARSSAPPAGTSGRSSAPARGRGAQ